VNLQQQPGQQSRRDADDQSTPQRPLGTSVGYRLLKRRLTGQQTRRANPSSRRLILIRSDLVAFGGDPGGTRLQAWRGTIAIGELTAFWYSSPSGCSGSPPTLGRTLDCYQRRWPSSDRGSTCSPPNGDPSVIDPCHCRRSEKPGIPPGQHSLRGPRRMMRL